MEAGDDSHHSASGSEGRGNASSSVGSQKEDKDDDIDEDLVPGAATEEGEVEEEGHVEQGATSEEEDDEQKNNINQGLASEDEAYPEGREERSSALGDAAGDADSLADDSSTREELDGSACSGRRSLRGTVHWVGSPVGDWVGSSSAQVRKNLGAAGRSLLRPTLSFTDCVNNLPPKSPRHAKPFRRPSNI